MDPGEYRATCTALKPPELYRAFARWYMRVDFAIHNDGAVVSKYLNLGTGKEPNTQLGPRSDYFKLWSLAVGRKPEMNEPMDPAKIIGVEFLVMVGAKQRGGDGEAYSTVESVRREPEAQEAHLLSGSMAHSLNHSMAHSLNSSTAQVHSVAQVHSTAQVQTDVAVILPEKPSVDEFSAEEISTKGQERAKLFKKFQQEDPEKAQRFQRTYKRLADAA